MVHNIIFHNKRLNLLNTNLSVLLYFFRNFQYNFKTFQYNLKKIMVPKQFNETCTVELNNNLIFNSYRHCLGTVLNS